MARMSKERKNHDSSNLAAPQTMDDGAMEPAAEII